MNHPWWTRSDLHLPLISIQRMALWLKSSAIIFRNSALTFATTRWQFYLLVLRASAAVSHISEHPFPAYLLQLSCIHYLGFHHEAMSIYTVILEIHFFLKCLLSWRPHRIFSFSVNYSVVVPCCFGPKLAVVRFSYLDPFNLISLFLF